MSEKETTPEEYIKTYSGYAVQFVSGSKVITEDHAIKALELARKEGEERIRLKNLKHTAEIYRLAESFRRQFDWIKENHPTVYEDLAEWSKKLENISLNKSLDLEKYRTGVQLAISNHIENYEILVSRLTDHELWIIEGIQNIINKYFDGVNLPEKGDNNGKA